MVRRCSSRTPTHKTSRSSTSASCPDLPEPSPPGRGMPVAGLSTSRSAWGVRGTVKFISPTDPKWLSTLDALTATLVSDSLVYRYDPQASPDGVRGAEGTFSACSFWYVEALTRAGRLEEPRLAFEQMLTYANHLGLYAE